jgi:hypothetical protein
MNARRLALVGMATALSLQGCNTAYTTDILERSTSQVTLPLAGVRLPPSGDSGAMVQASFALKAQRSGPHPVVLDHSGGESSYSIETKGANSTLMTPGVQVAGMANLWVNPRFRLGLAVDASRLGGTFGIETGIRLGEEWSEEVFAGTGIARLNSSTDWRVQTTQYDDGDQRTDTTLQRNSTQGDHTGGYGLLGIHLGARRDGPWVEATLLHQVLFDAWSKNNGIWFNSAAAAVGWSIYTEYGVATLFGRAMYIGQTWTPSAGIQVTVCLGMPDSRNGRDEYPAHNRWKGAMPP